MTATRLAWQVSRSDWDAMTALRGLAAFYVMISHIWFQIWPAVAPPLGYGITPSGTWLKATAWLYYGHYAVVFFIVLSGFSLAASCRMNLPRYKVRAFYWRRFMRIAPPYYVALLVSGLVIWLTGSEHTGSQWDISVPVTTSGVVSHLLMLQDFVDSTQINYAMWSVAAEFHLYLCFPMMVRFAERMPWWSILVVYGAVYGLIAGLTQLAIPDFPLPYLGLIAHFYAGIWACKQRQWLHAALWRLAPVMGLLALAALMALSLALGFVRSEQYLAYLDVLCTAAAVLLLWALTGSNTVRLKLGRSWWRGVGDYAYSLYLTHAPLIFAIWLVVRIWLNEPHAQWLALCLLCPPICMAFASWFHHRFERPFVAHLDVPAAVHLPLRS